MSLNFIKVVITTILLSVTTACTTAPQNQASLEKNLITDQKIPTANNQSATNRPPKKTATISVEGEKTTVDLKLYQAPNLFSIYFPEK
ncbi:MAG: hypothetical protein EAZ77_15715, partial [Nostocales cyanobacterium]